MSSPEPAYIPSPIVGALAAVLAVAQAVLVIGKRLGRVTEIESQVGRLPFWVRACYVWPQYAYRVLFVLIAFAGFLGLVAFAFQSTFSWRPFVVLRESGGDLAVAWVVIGVVGYTNLLSWLFLGPTLLLGLLNPSGRVLSERHPDWHAVRSFLVHDENAKPLVVNQRSADAFADFLVTLLRGAEPEDRAAAPAKPAQVGAATFRSQLGNGLLAGCVLEEAYNDLQLKPTPKWGPFYGAIGDVAAQTEVFSIHSVVTKAGESTIADSILQELNTRLPEHGQAPVPYSATVLERLTATFKKIADEYGGDASSIDSDHWWGRNRRLESAYKRLRSLPTLTRDAMRTQFVKLAVVWHVWTNVPLSAFRFPFAHRVAAVLLDREVIRAPEDVKVLTFDNTREIQVADAAERIVVQRAVRLIESRREEHERWLPAPSKGLTGEPFRWWVTYELDVRLWTYAGQLQKGTINGAAPSRWKSEGTRVVRIGTKA